MLNEYCTVLKACPHGQSQPVAISPKPLCCSTVAPPGCSFPVARWLLLPTPTHHDSLAHSCLQPWCSPHFPACGLRTHLPLQSGTAQPWAVGAQPAALQPHTPGTNECCHGAPAQPQVSAAVLQTGQGEGFTDILDLSLDTWRDPMVPAAPVSSGGISALQTQSVSC